MHGLVIKNTGSWYQVKTDDGQFIECKIKGNFRLKGIRSTNPIAVGDRVQIITNQEGTAFINEIEDRKNYIIRRSSNLSKQSHILAANLDQCMLVVTVNYPETSTIFIDRFLASAEAYRVPVKLVFNKVDVYNEEELHYLDALINLYTHIGYPITFLLMSGITLILCTMTSHMTIQSEMIAEREKRLAEAEMEKMRANLLRAISHDLRTPLTGIIGNSSLFLESQNDLSSTEQRTIMTNIYEDSNWLLNMVENLLSVTRIQGDSLSINTTEEPVEEVVGEALEKLKKRYPDAAIRVRIPEEFLMIPMDAVLIEQVTINLLENAIVHSGSILPIDFIVEDHPEHVSFIVRDYGKGLSEEKLQNLFETGTYNNSRSSDSRKGMGIGLSICKTIITAHHGTLSGRNHADGAEFCFTLPKAEALASEK